MEFRDTGGCESQKRLGVLRGVLQREMNPSVRQAKTGMSEQWMTTRSGLLPPLMASVVRVPAIALQDKAVTVPVTINAKRLKQW